MPPVRVSFSHLTLDPDLRGDDRQRDNINNNRDSHIADRVRTKTRPLQMYLSHYARCLCTLELVKSWTSY